MSYIVPISNKKTPVPEFSKFDQFWSAYPHKRAKGEARKAWKQVDGDMHFAEIMAGANAYRIHALSVEPRFRKFPAGWLRDERWYDEYNTGPIISDSAARLLQMSATPLTTEKRRLLK